MATALTTQSGEANPLAGRFRTPPASDALRPTPATMDLVKSQVQALLVSSPSYHELAEDKRASMAHNLTRIAAYAAECMRDMCWQSEKLGQTPVVRKRELITGPLARAQTSNFQPSAASQIGKVTKETLRAISFPTFVSDLIRSTFNAIVQTSIQQMEAFGQMLSNVSKTVDEFMQDNISDNQARDWLQQKYPDHIQVQDGHAVPRDGAEEKPAPNFARDLHLPGDVGLDESSIEEKLVPAARRRLAETRLQMLSTLVLMGVNRIVITGGKIRATMGFHIDTTDRAHEEHATDFDTRVAAAGSFGFGPWSVSASMSVAYVSSTRASSDSEINTETDLTGEVELHFKSDYFPVERFANRQTLGSIQGNTAVPEANTPVISSGNALADAAPAVGGDVPKFSSPRTHRAPRTAPTLPPIGSPLPPPRMPVEPTAPTVRRREDGAASPSGGDTTSSPTTPGADASPASPDASTPAGDSAGGTVTTPAPPAPPAAGQKGGSKAARGAGGAPRSGQKTDNAGSNGNQTATTPAPAGSGGATP